MHESGHNDFIVGLGLELPELLYELAEIARERIKYLGERLPVLAKSRRDLAKVIAFFGWFLIIGGVIGERVSEANIYNLDATIEGCNDARLIEATSEAGDAKTSAKDATDAATVAKDQSGSAVASAASAQILANGARKEADSFEKDIVSAKQQAADAESHLADALQRAANAEAELTRLKMPRSIVHGDELVAALRSYKGVEYTLTVFSDDESIQLTKAIGAVLHEAGWIRKQPPAMSLGVPTMEVAFTDGGAAELVPTCVATGISINVKTKESLAVLQATPESLLPKVMRAALALRLAIPNVISPQDERSADKGIIDPKPGEDSPMMICVGKKP